jgi:hypothetical protein
MNDVVDVARSIAELTKVGETSFWEVQNEKHYLRIIKLNEFSAEFSLFDKTSRQVECCEADLKNGEFKIGTVLQSWKRLYPLWKVEGDNGPEMKVTIGAQNVTESNSAASIARPPGFWLISTAEFLMSKKQFCTLVVPTIADMREEYYQALAQNRIWKARWVRIRGTWSFFAAIRNDRLLAMVSFFIKAWKSVN